MGRRNRAAPPRPPHPGAQAAVATVSIRGRLGAHDLCNAPSIASARTLTVAGLTRFEDQRPRILAVAKTRNPSRFASLELAVRAA